MRLRGQEFWWSVLAQAMGTVLAGGVLAAVGIAAGAIDISWWTVTWFFMGLALVCLAMTFYFLIQAGRVGKDIERSERAFLSGLAERFDEAEVSDTGVWAMLSRAEQAELMEIYAERSDHASTR